MSGNAVVTGAGSGIGRGTALMLAGQGWTVFGLDRSAQSLAATAAQVPAGCGGSVVPIACDVVSSAEVKRAFEQVGSRTGTLDALVCSAGVLRPAPLTDMDEADFDDTFAINVKGVWLTVRAAVPLLEQGRDRPRAGRIVILGSAAALRPKVGGGAYAASKIAVSYVGRVLAAELAPRRILVNVVAPATVDTEMTQALQARPGYRLSGASPLGRVALPEDVTGVIGFLLSDGAGYISGAVIPVDGATTAAFNPG